MLGDIGDLPLQSGAVLRQAQLAYTTYGTLAPAGRNAVLMTHGYTSSHRFVDGGGASEGTWGSLVGPGCAIDTDRFFVVSSNMLGSSYGSTAPRSIDPATGRHYGPDFPPLALPDIVGAQRRLLERLGVRALVAVVGPSYGGFQAFTWAIEHPDFVRAIVPVVTGLRSPRTLDLDALERRFAADPGWNGGRYYESGGIGATMAALREETLRGYGIEAELAPRFPDRAACEAEIARIARGWAAEFDAHSLLVLGRAAAAYDAEPLVARIRARVLYVLSRTDALFPPSLAPTVMAALATAGVDARYAEIDSPHGHLASGTDAAKWAPALRAFMAEVGD
jgi:homoserine O-acetyltransferase